VIIRIVPPSRSLKERLKVAHFPFPCNVISRAPCPVSAKLFDQLYDKLYERKRFQMTEKNTITRLLDTTRNCEDGVSDRCAVKVADRLISKGDWEQSFANALFAGTVIERQNNQGEVSVEISGQMVDYANKEILTSVDIYAEKLNQQNFKPFNQGLVTEISDAFPMVDAKITQVSGEQLKLDMTEQDRVWALMPLLIYQTDGNSGCANARLQEVDEVTTQAVLENNQCQDISSIMHRVITR